MDPISRLVIFDFSDEAFFEAVRSIAKNPDLIVVEFYGADGAHAKYRSDDPSPKVTS